MFPTNILVVIEINSVCNREHEILDYLSHKNVCQLHILWDEIVSAQWQEENDRKMFNLP